MATHDATGADEAAEPLAGMAGEALGEGGDGMEGVVGSNAWSFWFRALMAMVVVISCFVASRVIRGETPDERRLRLRAERRAKRKAAQEGPDEIDKLLSSVVRRQPGAPVPANAVPLGGRGMPRGVLPGGGAGRGTGSAAAAAARLAAAGRGNGAGRGPPPPGSDRNPKLRWDQTNEEVEIVIRVDPKVARSDVKVDITATMIRLSLRGQVVIAGLLYRSVDPEGCNWQIDDPGLGHPKEVTITLLKAEPTTSRETWWRAPLKGLENRGQPVRRPTQPADPEMVRKAIEAIKAKSAGAAVTGAKPSGVNPVAAAAAPAAAGVPMGAVARASPAAAAVAASPADVARVGPATAPTGTTKPNKGGGKKKNRKKK